MRDVEGFVYLAACALACIFAFAGAGKVGRIDDTREAFRLMAIPAPRLLAVLTALTELGLAALLVVFPRAGALGALALLSVFSALLSTALRSGREVSCGCFGTAARKPVSRVMLVRNGLLAVLALLAAAAMRPAVPSFPEVVLLTSCLLVGALVLSLLELRLQAGGVWSNRMAFETFELP